MMEEHFWTLLHRMDTNLARLLIVAITYSSVSNVQYRTHVILGDAVNVLHSPRRRRDLFFNDYCAIARRLS